VVAVARPNRPDAVLRSSIRPLFPSLWPQPSKQTCNLGAKVDVTFANGVTLCYGPCSRPAFVVRIRRAMLRAVLLHG
jgi:hypothetical protein